MTPIMVRPATEGDLPALTDIYNHYIVTTPITFDLRPLTVDERRAWLVEHSHGGRHRLLVGNRQQQMLSRDVLVLHLLGLLFRRGEYLV